MAYFKIIYGISFDSNEEYIEAKDHDEAMHEAWVAACTDYDSYAGLYGIPSEAQIAAELYGEKYGSDEEGDMEDGSTIFEYMTDAELQEVGAAYREERESWISYSAEEVSQREYETKGEEEEEFEIMTQDVNDYILNVGQTCDDMKPYAFAYDLEEARTKALEFRKTWKCVEIVYKPCADVDVNQIIWAEYEFVYPEDWDYTESKEEEEEDEEE